MKEFTTLLGFPLFLLVTVWGLLKTMYDLTTGFNGLRDSALGIGVPVGQTAPSLAIRLHRFHWDWLPLSVCYAMAILVTFAVIILIPKLFKLMTSESQGTPEPKTDEKALIHHMAKPTAIGLNLVEVACYGLGALVLIVFLAQVTSMVADLRFVHAHAPR